MKGIQRYVNVTEIVRPIGHLLAFSVGSAALMSAIVIVLALILDRTVVGADLMDRYNVSLYTYTMINLPQVVIDGLTIGFVYAAIALGYTMVYGVLEFINFAHSEIFAVGAFVGVELLIALDATGVLAGATLGMAYAYLIMALLAGMLAAGGLAMAVERVAYRPLRGASRLVPLISAIGVSFLLQDLIRLVESLTTGQFNRIMPTFGNFDQRIILGKLNMGASNITLGISIKSIIVIAAAVLMLVALNYLVNATRIGKAMRAVAQDRGTASLMGINVNRIISITFLVGGLLGGAAGVLFALKFTRIDPFVGFFPGLKAFTAAVLGGIGNLTGALLGGLVLGMLETFAGSFMGVFTMGAAGSEYKDIFAFSILILVLIFRPQGLMGKHVGQKA
ncbi:branched-chain amino acid ABC transporter permease [Desulfofustis limnaeus]|jgi:branched-chain amino acid transport system permease protein|uniref:Branched-chain amino acid ABC transporter permease n=1 Tax=Desulfofustis limnaeus TaxID=2740163 RepID=A0ABN6M235_9BACT|nr:branched-chain amino acid ABC transporter permease [Desulfofustis limnaeus]MDX9894056.1 branched-chain amino acid ABC transporter permease [Desulfofustis sp.]BDD85890.1 branched-chain amino acid ABC transporter permease [Desulfofustis limnaeus]